MPRRLQDRVVKVVATTEAEPCYIFSSDRWRLHSSFHWQDWSYPCVNRRVAITSDHRPTRGGAAVPPSTHVSWWGDSHPKEVGREAMPARPRPNLIGKTRLSYICTYIISGMCNASLEQSKLHVPCKQAIFGHSVNTSRNIISYTRPPINLPSLPLNGNGVLNNMIKSIDQGHVGAIMSDMSAAFDTVDHTIMLDVLLRRFGLQDEALNWLKDFLTDRSQAIHNGATESDDVALWFGVPQGSVIRPKSFMEYRESWECVRQIPAPPPSICWRHARAVKQPSIIRSGDRFNSIKLLHRR